MALGPRCRAALRRAARLLLPAAALVLLAARPAERVSGGDPIETVLARLTTADKVGQLLMVGYGSLDADTGPAAIVELRAGAVVLGNGFTAEEARARIDQLQERATASGLLPLLVAVDHEGGPVQRIRIGMSDLGPSWRLGQLHPIETAVSAACQRGAIHGRELAELGITMNLAPVLDVWDNPRNTVIADRAFSDDPQVVAQLGAAYIEALQAQGVLAVGKHFPGHGSTAEDSHLTLPVNRKDRAALFADELVPFRAALQAGVAGIMVSHVSYPALEPEDDRPASLSWSVVTGLLRNELGFDGLVLTDDLGAMRAITASYDPGEAAVQALQAGADLLIVVGPYTSHPRIIQAITAELGRRISPERLDAAVRRVLQAKLQAGLLGPAPRIPGPAAPVCPPA